MNPTLHLRSFSRILFVFIAVHYPRNSSTFLLRSRCFLGGVCAALLLVLVNSVPLIKLSLQTDTAQIHMGTASAEEGGGPDALAGGTDGHAFALDVDTNAGAGQRALGVGIEVVAASTPPFYEDGALEDCAKGHSVQKQTQVQATLQQCDTRNRLESNKFARGGDKRIISWPA